MIQAVAFDLDNTLYDHAQFVRGAYADVATTAAALAGVDRQRFLDRILGDWQRLTSRANTIFADALRDFGADPAFESELVAAYRNHRPALEPYPGVEAGMTALKQTGLRLGLLTDGRVSVQARKLNALGLAHVFDTVVITGALGPAYYKPHPAGFEAVASRLGTHPASMVYVGDNPLVDFAAAKGLGMRTVRVRTAEFLRHTEGAAWIDHTVDTTRQAIDWLLGQPRGAVPSWAASSG